MKLWIGTVIGLLVSVSVGCIGMTSTMLNRTDSDDYSINKPAGRIHHVTKGVPVTMKVFSHLDVRIVETLYYTDHGKSGLQPVLMGRRLFDVSTKPIRTSKVFTVDFKRPGGGSLGYKADFNEQQYFTTFKNKITDETISDINKALGRTKPIIKKFLSTGGGPIKLATDNDDISQQLVEVQRHVAYQRFDINDPNFEFNIDTFISQHLNNCHSCQTPPSIPVNHQDK